MNRSITMTRLLDEVGVDPNTIDADVLATLNFVHDRNWDGLRNLLQTKPEIIQKEIVARKSLMMVPGAFSPPIRTKKNFLEAILSCSSPPIEVIQEILPADGRNNHLLTESLLFCSMFK